MLISSFCSHFWAVSEGFPVHSVVKDLPAMQEMQVMWVLSLDADHPLEEGMGIHSSFRAWKIPWAEEPGGLQSLGLKSQI